MAANNPQYKNSAGRLLEILKRFPQNQQIIEFLPQVLGYDKGGNQQETQLICLTCLIELHKLYVQFREDMLDDRISDDERRVLLSGVKGIETIIYPIALNSNMRGLSEAEKALLEVCATRIPQEDALEQDDVEKIRQSVASLRSLVEQGDISPTLRKALLELIRLTEDAIARFHIHGARGLKTAFKAMLGEAIDLYATERTNGREAEFKKSGVWQAIMRHLDTVDRVAARILKYQPVLEKGAQILLGGPQ
jgi:hypothetical protein